MRRLDITEHQAVSLAVYVGGKGKEPAKDSEPERNFGEERLRHASRLIKAVHSHDAEGADDAMRAHHAVCADEDDARKE
jgi:hypothetical protein